MMMRSMPPASSALAERPVPAPPPMMGTPASIMPLNFWMMSLRGMAGMVFPCCLALMSGDGVEGGDGRFGEPWVVGVQRQPLDTPVFVRPDGALDGLEQGSVGLWVEEGTAFDIERRHAFFR